MKLRAVDLCKTWRREAAKQLTKTPPYSEAPELSGLMRFASLSRRHLPSNTTNIAALFFYKRSTAFIRVVS